MSEPNNTAVVDQTSKPYVDLVDTIDGDCDLVNWIEEPPRRLTHDVYSRPSHLIRRLGDDAPIVFNMRDDYGPKTERAMEGKNFTDKLLSMMNDHPKAICPKKLPEEEDDDDEMPELIESSEEEKEEPLPSEKEMFYKNYEDEPEDEILPTIPSLMDNRDLLNSIRRQYLACSSHQTLNIALEMEEVD